MRADNMVMTDELLEKCFPGFGGRMNETIRRLSTISPKTRFSDDDIQLMDAIGGNLPGIAKLTVALSSDSMIAMEYLGPIPRFKTFDCSRESHPIAGPGIDVIVFTDTEGIPCGIRVLEEHVEPFEAYSSVKGSGCIIVTDVLPYSTYNIRALEASGCDYILRERPFPISYGPSSQQKMLQLKYEGIDYSACKCRYDKRWLFMFRREEDVKTVRRSVSSMDLKAQDLDYLTKTAGYENALSNVGHDIREVRRLMDFRARMDTAMEYCRIVLSSDDRLLYNRDPTVGFILLFLLGQRP